MFINYKIVNH